MSALPVIAAVRSVNPDTITHPLGRAFVLEVTEHQITVVVFLALVGLCAKLTQWICDLWATNWKAVKAVLDSAHRVFFQGVAKANPDELYQHRVTLLRAGRRLRDFPGWRLLGTWPPLHAWNRVLKVHCRSGTAYQHSSAWLSIDDDDESANEGVAGRAWFTNAAVTVSNLPEWPAECVDPTTEPVCRDYAERGFMSPEAVQRIRIKSRSLSAHVVRTRTGERWGVLVFDSRDPEGVSDSVEKKHIMELSALLLSQLV